MIDCNRCSKLMECVVSTPLEFGLICRKCGNYGIIRKSVDSDGKESLQIIWDAIEVKLDSTHPVYRALWNAVDQHRSRKKK